MKLQDIHLQYDTDKGTFHSYIELYDHLFQPFQQQDCNVLEIGALTCGSLKMFNQYFASADIYGVDNWSQQADHLGQDYISKGVDIKSIIFDIAVNYPRIKLITCDSTNASQVQNIFAKKNFKIIIDDGDHNPHAQFMSCQNFLPFLEQDGIYIIEDVYDMNTLKHNIDALLHQHFPNLGATSYFYHKEGRQDDAVLVISAK